MKRFLVILMILSMFSAAQLFAASATDAHDVTVDIAEIAAMALTDNTTLTLTTTDPAQAGGTPQGDSDSARYLQYTTLNTTGMTRKIQCSLDAAAPAGTALRITLAGGLGTSAGQVTLTAVDQDVVTAIGSGNTGTTATDGDNLAWVLAITDSTQLVVASTTLTATFTLTEDTF
jgi:hypothetical protein